MIVKNDKLYYQIVENVNCIILCWTTDGKITFINDFGQRFFGYSESELVGHHVVGTIVPETDTRGRKLRPLIAEICANPTKHTHNLNENVRRNGERAWVNWTNKAVSDNHDKVILSIGCDVTERIRTEEALRISEQKFRNIFEEAPVGIYQSTVDGKFKNVNLKLARTFGYDSPELMVQSISDIGRQLFLNPEERNDLVNRAILSAGYVQKEVGYRRRDGTVCFANLFMRAVRDNAGRVAFLEGMIEDTTQRKYAEEELHKTRDHLESLVNERTAKLEEANEQLKELDRLKSMFIASMSHELRTPLNSIIGFTWMTLQGLSGDLNLEQKDNLSRVYQSAKHLLDLISDVIDISRIEAGKIVSNPESFYLREVVDEAVGTIMPQATEKNLMLLIDVPTGVQLYTDRKRFLQCLINLLSNAVKFTEKGEIAVISRQEEECIEISVRDTGIGIAEKDLPRIFKAFERLDSKLNVKAGGTGLGLYLTRKLVTDILQGTVSARSTEGKGSVFTLRIAKDVRSQSENKKV